MAETGDPVIAAADGQVTYTGNSGHAGGNEVTIYHGKDENGRHIRSTYSHLDTFSVVKGHGVKRGEQIGTLGRTGLAAVYPAHLHFGVWDTTAKRWEHLNPHDFWLRPPDAGASTVALILPFVPDTDYPSNPIRFTYPVPCKR